VTKGRVEGCGAYGVKLIELLGLSSSAVGVRLLSGQSLPVGSCECYGSQDATDLGTNEAVFGPVFELPVLLLLSRTMLWLRRHLWRVAPKLEQPSIPA
jgi:hypothetical protein